MLVAVATILSGGKAHAASFTVATGNDENTDNSSCSLSEAVENINNQATTNSDCSPTGSYGTDDTINLPAGTITLTADIPTITKSITIQGQGMRVSVVDGDDGTYGGFYASGTGSETIEFTGMTIQRVTQSGARATNVNLTINQLEVYGASDLVGSNTDLTNGIQFTNSGGHALSLQISNTHIHHLIADDDMTALLIEGNTVAGGSTDAVLTNITIDDLEATNAVTTNGIVFTQFDGVGHTMNVEMSNITITNIVGDQTVSGIATIAVAATANSTITADVHNVTIAGLVGSIGPFGGSGAFNIAGAQANNSYTALVNTAVDNLLLAGNTENGSPANCKSVDITPLLMGTGTPSLNLSSLGGNLSDETSCSSYFTQPTDQNNVTNLSSSLSALADNGGYVPTMALKQGSPAIDAGVVVTGLTTDARLVSRPQGLAFDSGAYEYIPLAATSSQSLASTGQDQAAALGIVVLLALPATAYAFRRKVTVV